MSIKTSDKSYCMSCKRELSEGEICYCDGKNYSIIFGNVIDDGDKFICICGNEEFTLTMHMNANPIYTKNYKCCKCNNVVGIETYYESPYLKFEVDNG